MMKIHLIFFAVFLVGIVTSVPVKLSQSCGTLTCPDNTVACVKRGSNTDNPKIIKTKYECVDGEGTTLASEEKTQDNPFGGNVQIQSISINYSGGLDDIPHIRPISQPRPIKPVVNNKDKNIYEDVETFDY